jgi:hypothetical protein
MKNKLYFALFVFFTLLSFKGWSQADSITIKSTSTYLLFSEIGGGWNSRGGNGVLSVTMTTAKGLGGSVNLTGGYQNLENVPADYYSFFLRWVPPTNDFTNLSFNLVKKFTTHNHAFRFGIEAGPSWVRYNITTIKTNPAWPDLFQYKYNKFYSIKNTAGFSMALKAEFPFSRFIGCDFTFFANLNSVSSIAGFDICLVLGKVRNR